MLFACITSLDMLETAIDVDGYEFRLDLFPCWDLSSVHNAIQTIGVPSIFTIRSSLHGGSFTDSEEKREQKIIELLKLKPSFFDLEWDMRSDFLDQVIRNNPNTKFILSYHNLESTPQNLEEIVHKMRRIGAFGYKIATMTHSTNDALRMLLLSKNNENLSAICMGTKGEFARALGKIVGNQINYAAFCQEKKVAPGQLSINDMISIYHYPKQTSKTALYGLIGNPVEMSRGHLFHNEYYSNNNIDAVYVKMHVEPQELTEFFHLAKELGFKGLSVTMPLKVEVLPFLTERDKAVQSCGSSNTLRFEKGRIYGTNTDGPGAIDAIEKHIPILGKKVVIIGAGGAARGVGFEAMRRGGEVCIVNRTDEKAKKLSLELGCNWADFHHFPKEYEILIGCTPKEIEVEEHWIIPGAVVMDITYVPKVTPLLQVALKKDCRVVYGEEMFIGQANLQTKFWSL